MVRTSVGLTAQLVQILDSRADVAARRVLAVDQMHDHAVVVILERDEISDLTGRVVIDHDIPITQSSQLSCRPSLHGAWITSGSLRFSGDVDPVPIEFNQLFKIDRRLLAIERQQEAGPIDQNLVLKPNGRALAIEIGTEGLGLSALAHHLRLRVQSAMNELAVPDLNFIGQVEGLALHVEPDWSLRRQGPR